MNILFLTIAGLKDLNGRGLSLDLINEISKKHNLYIVSSLQKRENLETVLEENCNYKILRVKTGNLTKNKSKIEKGFSMLMLESQYKKAINKYYKGIKFDVILYATPPITFNKLVSSLKREHNALSYLMLKDIFPQNAVDLNMIKENGVLAKYYRKKEIDLYKISDFIGTMSQGNMEYLLKMNKYIDPSKVEVFPNSIKPIDLCKISKEEKRRILQKYNIPESKCYFIFGGNFGKPQGINNIIQIAKRFDNVENGVLILVGNGSQFSKMQSFVLDNKLNNVLVLERLPKEDYDNLVQITDVGLVFLDERFTIPNYPSRMLSYMESQIPMIAATDSVTDVRNLIEENDIGYWSYATDYDCFIDNCNKLANDKVLRERQGKKARVYLERHFNIGENIEILYNHFKERKNV